MGLGSDAGINAARHLAPALKDIGLNTVRHTTEFLGPVLNKVCDTTNASVLTVVSGSVLKALIRRGEHKAQPQGSSSTIDPALSQTLQLSIHDITRTVSKVGVSLSEFCNTSQGVLAQGVVTLQLLTALCALLIAAAITAYSVRSPYLLIANGSWIIFCLISLVAVFKIWTMLLLPALMEASQARAMPLHSRLAPAVLAGLMQTYGNGLDDASFNSALHNTVTRIVATCEASEHFWVITTRSAPGGSASEVTVSGVVAYSSPQDSPCTNPKTGTGYKVYVLRYGNVFNRSDSVGLSSIKVTTQPMSMWSYSEASKHYQFHKVGEIVPVD
ncbi:hypothetical protein OC835_005152 [Tilletia horrida]|nr:hypothetical protein OC835_005152 [Tilletia horrida]